MNSNPCPTGCGGQRLGRHLMCARCWGEVPRHLQRDVNRTWRAWRADFGDAEKMLAYEAAANAAEAAVR